jgi:hypothetical protein
MLYNCFLPENVSAVPVLRQIDQRIGLGLAWYDKHCCLHFQPHHAIESVSEKTAANDVWR